MTDDAVKLARDYLAAMKATGDDTSKAAGLARAVIALSERLNTAEVLLAIVELMDGDDTTGTVKVFRASRPSLADLFREDDGDALYLNEAVKRFGDGPDIDRAREASKT